MARQYNEWVQQAINSVYTDYGVRVSPDFKCKNLLKFGRNIDVETAIATLMILPDTIDNETYVSSNIITSIVSTSGSDTEVMRVEGHTVDGSGNFTFVVQNVTLTGQSAATLTTPLARVTRTYATGSTDLVGAIAICQDDTYSSGVPQTPAGVHLLTRVGQNQSEKCATTISNSDYWVITGFYSDMLTKAASFGEVDLEIRLKGKVFRQVADISVSDSHRGYQEFKPYVIAPANSDIRLRAISDSSSGRDIAGGIQGFLMDAIG